MSSEEPLPILRQDASLTAAINLLGPDSHTTHRLRHASAEHLHLTTRRCFVGPIPEGWLKSHRNEWYKHYLGIHHSSKAPTFSAADNVGSQRRMTAIDGPRIQPSFPQPSDIDAGASSSNAPDTIAAAAADDEEENLAEEEPLSQGTPERRDGGDTEGNETTTRTAASVHDSPRSPTAAKSIESRTRAIPSNRRLPPSVTSKNKPKSRKASTTSYRTASEDLGELSPEPFEDAVESIDEIAKAPEQHTGTPGITVVKPATDIPQERSNAAGSLSLTTPASPALSGQVGSTASLLRVDHDGLSRTSSRSAQASDAQGMHGATQGKEPDAQALKPRPSVSGRRVSAARPQIRFDLPDEASHLATLKQRARMAHIGLKSQGRMMTPSKRSDGEILKMEKMLLRVDIASGSDQPEADFTEKDSLRIETRVLEKWREFMVVCRTSDSETAAITLQMYQSRVIPASNQSKTKKRYKHCIPLDRATVRVNLYSSLDKTIAVSTREGPKTKIYYLRTRSGTSAVEWFHFLRQCLGLRRAKTIQVNIPDLSASVRLENPFDRIVDEEELEKAAEGDEEALAKAVQAESAVATKIIDRCLEMLSNGEEWSGVLDLWATHDHIGLAWRRYDRLEWIHGEHERKMYGANAMLRTHELELRVKQHYPQSTKTKSGKALAEPAPVEGFLIRLTSQKGAYQKFGKFFFKRLYFSTHNQYLVFLRPAKARPPPPPAFPTAQGSQVPSSRDIAGKIPLIYAVNPYPVEEGEVAWLRGDGETTPAKHEEDAADEIERITHTMQNCEGFINLCDVVKVREYHHGADEVDEQLDIGSDVDYDMEVGDTSAADGKTTEVDADRTLELVLRNGLIIRLQAFSRATKEEWIRRLRDLVRYWTRRAAADMDLFKSVRAENLRALNIDERAEAHVGQFSQKWEVGKSFASPELYNMCGISQCRAIHTSGALFRKPRIHATFSRCHAILCHGMLLLFRDTTRSRTGKRTPHIQHDRIASIDLKDCYLYSGLITENDLLYQNRTFDPNAGGSSALPRMFLEDQWTSTDEDAMTTFVIWHGQRKGWFRSREVDDVKARDEGKKGGVSRKLKRVNQLGVKGKSIVFKARSRAERDHWVLAISTEIERVSKDDGVRVEGE